MQSPAKRSDVIRFFIAVAFSVALAGSASAQTAKTWTQIGMLTCKVNPNIGFIIAGHKSMECRFVPSNPTIPPELYQGALNTVGINVGISAGGVLGWAVLAPTAGSRRARSPANMLGPRAILALVSVLARIS